MTVVTYTVNQWHIKHNAENPDDLKPVVCVNSYEWCYLDYVTADTFIRRWGPKVGETEHHYDLLDIPGPVDIIYDPVNKTPCGASCWMEYEEY